MARKDLRRRPFVHLKSEALSERQKIVRFRDALVDGIFQRAEAEGLPDFFLLPQEITERDEQGYLEEAGGDVGVEEISSEPLLALAEGDVEVIKSYRGEDLKNYLFTLTKRFENMVNAKTTGQLVAGLISGGVLAIGASFTEITVKALREGMALASAIRAGIQGIGIRLAFTLVAVVFAVLVLYLFLNNPKKVLGLVINQTAEDFVVRDFQKAGGRSLRECRRGAQLHGGQRGWPGLSKVQLKRRRNFGPGNKDNAVFAGIYFIDKKVGIFGAEGMALFSSTSSDLRFAHLFGSPYNRDNGTNMAFVPGMDKVDLKKLFDDLYGSRKVRVVVEKDGYELAAAVNDARGGVVGCIASISKAA